MSDADDSAAVIDLLAALAYGELTAFFQLVTDAQRAHDLGVKAALGSLAVNEFGRFEVLRDRLEAIGAVPEEAMSPFVAALDAFHERTAPQIWLEGLVKAYVGEGIAADFYREVSALLGPEVHDLVTDVLRSNDQADFVVDQVRAAIEADPRVSGRLSLYGRRLVGEALSQAQRVAADRDSLTRLLIAGPTGRGGADLADLVRLFGRITEAHADRMRRLGLDP